MKRKAIKQVEAQARQASRDSMTAAQQVAQLDQLFGKSQGAKRERGRLQRAK